MNMKRVFLGLAFLGFAALGAVAQDRVLEKPQILINLAQSDGAGEIEIIQSEQIENMLKMQIANNRLQDGKIPGYRIRIHSRAGRPEADQIQMDFMRRFPELIAHREYNAPNFQIFVGDFRTRNDALRELKRIERFFQGAFLVSQLIDISN